MNNCGKAVQVIRRQTLVSDLATAKDVVRRLDQAGLLAPELPEPDKAGFCHTDNAITRVLPNLLVEAGFYGQGVDTYVKLTPAEAREVAHALLAAANYSEDRQA